MQAKATFHTFLGADQSSSFISSIPGADRSRQSSRGQIGGGSKLEAIFHLRKGLTVTEDVIYMDI